MKTVRVCATLLVVLSLCVTGAGPSAALPDVYRSPIDLAIVPGGRFVVTANHTADSVSLIDLAAGAVVAEQGCGHKPSALACSRDGKRVAVSNLWSGTVTLFDLRENGLRSLAEVKVGPLLRGLVFARDGSSLYVAVAGADEVVQLDWHSRKITSRLSAPREPRHLALSVDGKCLAAASSRSGQVRCWNTQTRELLWERKVEDGFNLRALAFSADGRAVICPHSVRRSFPVSQANIAEGWVIDSRLSQLPLDPHAVAPLCQIALDERGKAVGDPYGLAVSGDGHLLAVTGSGTHELLVFENSAIHWEAGDPGDVISPDLLGAPGKRRRVPLGGRPLSVAFLDGRDEAVVANYLLDRVQIVNCKAGTLVREIPLGHGTPSPARQGEALFYDAQRSHDQWFSCSTCHVEGHTCGLTFDTLNDDSYGNPKLTPSLHNVLYTGPWTWHGWQKDLGAAVEKSLTQTMFGRKPTSEEKQALLAFLSTLEPPPNPYAGSNQPGSAARRGEALFNGKANCNHCHHGKYFTSSAAYDVGLEPDGSPYPRWNPPSLLGLWERSPYLHDGRAQSLEDLLKIHHVPEKLAGEKLTDTERRELIEYLRTL